MKIGAIILSAGQGIRYKNSYKLLSEYNGKSMVRTVVEKALQVGFDPIIIVAGYRHEEIEQEISDLSVITVINPEWYTGQASSFRCGIQALEDNVDSIAALLADMPAVSIETLQTLMKTQIENPDRLIAPFYQGRRGNPVLFPQWTFPMILSQSSGDSGGRFLLKEYGAIQVATDDWGVIADVDTVEDYQALAQLKNTP